ncbi:ATP-binding protein [Streptomyces uncialis]|uniref:AAA family ATPase n=1 Tax=Streptomyces uncialis TaxID=1048205 RepID=UPI002E3293F2|nr:AAA family ATPase [Streptomyces uncialis]
MVTDDWDDWFQFNTQYDLRYQDEHGDIHDVGQVKIGQFDMAADQSRPDLPSTFSQLDNRFFSVGQDDSYYQSLNRLGSKVRDEILRGLHDIALDSALYTRALRENVTGTSLLRSVSRATVEIQFRRLARGGRRLSRYHFTYELPSTPRSQQPALSLEFEVVPESEPPTNIHVLIGRNGVGKTHLLNHMARALADPHADPEEVGTFTMRGSDRNRLANLVSVTFSAFDPFEPISQPRDKTKVVLPYAYIGLKRIGSKVDGKPLPPKDPRALASEFTKSVQVCVQGARLVRWRRALEMLEADPIFSDARVADLAESAADAADLAERASLLYRNLSSGHKIVLLTITRLVETVEESSLVLLDEPEAHLHPPLLSAFTRALSDLLINRNGVAVIATHSPVVLQEVPRKCAWRLRRSGREVLVEQPGVETFGENVGVLTREIFGLEVTRSGFHRVLQEAVEGGASYEDILERFDGQLGGEARGLIRALVAARVQEGEL